MVMVWRPAERVLVESVAVPAESGMEPSRVPPSVKLTAPVGVAVPVAAETVAARVTV